MFPSADHPAGRPEREKEYCPDPPWQPRVTRPLYLDPLLVRAARLLPSWKVRGPPAETMIASAKSSATALIILLMFDNFNIFF